MPKISPERFYSLLEAQKITGIKTREYISRYIRDGLLLAIQTGTDGPRVRYSIRGNWLIDFIDRYKNGNIKGKQFSKEEVKARLEQAIRDLGFDK